MIILFEVSINELIFFVIYLFSEEKFVLKQNQFKSTCNKQRSLPDLYFRAHRGFLEKM